MRVAEIFKDKKGKEKISLFFTDKNLNKEISKIPSAMYYQNHKQWILLCNKKNIFQLQELNFSLYNNSCPIKIGNIIIKNNYICILADEMTRYKIIKYFTFYDTKNCMRNRKFDFSKAEKIEFFYLDNCHIYVPIGLKNELFCFLVHYYKPLDVRKIRKYKYTDDEIKNCLGYLQLYPEQIQAVKNCFHNVNGIIDLIGGLGKTEIILSLSKLMNLKTLIITESIDIARQTYERALNAKLNSGIVQGDNVNENHQIVICTIQSSHKLKNKYEMALVDEVHNVSEEYNKILSNKNILYRFGFSASVFGNNKIKNMIVKQFIGNVIYTKENKKLINEGKVAKPNFKIIKINKPNLNNIKNWKVIEKLGIIQNNYRNEMILKICQKYRIQILILVKKIEHGNEIKELLERNDIKCIFIHGGTKKEERKKILNEFDKNRNKFVLIGSTILKEGVSIDAVFNLIYAGAGNSFVDTLQSIFRGTRIKIKNKFNVFDFLDEFNPITLKHSNKRIKLYKEKIYNNIKYMEV